MINVRKAAVKIDKTWHFVFGQAQSNGNLIFILNGKVDQSLEGYWRLFDRSLSQGDVESEVIRMNLNELIYAHPKKRKLPVRLQ